MPTLLNRLRGERSVPTITSIDDYIGALNNFQYGGLTYPFLSGQNGVQQTIGGTTTERAPTTYVGLATHAHAGNDVVFSCMLVRQLVFSSISFRWQRLRDGKASDSFGSTELDLLDTPWVGGTTQDLLSRTIQDADLAGNAYWTRQGNELIRLRPDWVEIVVEPRVLRDRPGQLGWKKVGYLYTEFGPGSGAESVAFLPDEVAHFAPIPDPLATYRGMSWLTPIVRQIQGDLSMTRHKQKFFDNGATPNIIIKHVAGADPAKVQRFKEMLEEKHSGVDNAYKNLHLYPGADATVVGKDFRQVDFKGVQGAAETRIAAAAGVPPVIVGLSEGLAAATYSNYGQARRRLADGTAHPLWQNVAGSFAPLLQRPGPGTRLWYNAADVPFLREDEKDAAEIAEIKARTIEAYIRAGYEPASVVAAVESGDLRLLQHTGLYSVQLQKPGAEQSTVPALPAGDNSDPATQGDGNGNSDS
jgi:phage portal protein BeeE